MSSDDEWVSDTESVEGDEFNRSNFNKVRAKVAGEGPEIVKGTAKPGFGGMSIKPSAPMEVSMAYEKQEQQESYELKQAREIKAHQPAPIPPPAPVKIQSSKPSMPAVNYDYDVSEVRKESKQDGRFNGIYDQEVIDFFTKMNEKSFTEQAIEYLNAYWDEVGDQAEFIFSVAHKVFTEADMHRQGITLYYKYEEGSNVDYPTYLYFYEKLVKFVQNNPEWREGRFEKSAVYAVKTAIQHKKELQEKVDVNFDGKISFLEYLLYQYNVYSNPAQFMQRARNMGEEHPAIIEARLALQKVAEQIKAYEEERARLEEGSKLPGVKGLGFQHQLAILDVSPLAEALNKALITAEAAVRMAMKKFSSGSVANFDGVSGSAAPRGALWWMQRDLEEKKKYKKK